MEKRTVRNKDSGEIVTFNWFGKNPPTDEEMEEIFASANELKKNEAETQNVPPSDFIGAMSPKMPKNPPYSMEDTKKYVRPVLEFGGMTAGGVVGTGAGPAGTVAGAGLGYGMGKKSADLIYGKPQGSVGEELFSSAVDVSQGAAMEMGGAAVGALAVKFGKPAADKIYRTVRRGVEKAIRPGVARQRTAAQTKKYFEDATEAVSNIILNKDNLRLTSESGKIVKGLPKTLKQFSEAIGQTKKEIFKKYDELANIATGAGVRVRVDTIADELLTMTESRPFVDNAPQAAKYAMEKAETLIARRSYTPAEAQEAIQILNQSLESFYKNPSYETATKAAVDSLVANNLRRNLEETINSLTGKSYQGLKNVYGALSNIERDVARRSAVDARKNIKGLIDFSDILSGAEVVHGIVSMNPGFFAKGVAAKAIASTYKFLNNPNRIVKLLFSDVENMMTKQAIASSGNISSSASGRALGRAFAYGQQNYYEDNTQ